MVDGASMTAPKPNPAQRGGARPNTGPVVRRFTLDPEAAKMLREMAAEYGSIARDDVGAMLRKCVENEYWRYKASEDAAQP